MTDFGLYLLDPVSLEKTYELQVNEGECELDLFGGCGLGRFTIPWKVESYKQLSKAYIYWPVRFDVLDNPLWQGRIESIRNVITKRGESIELTCVGWGLYLKNVTHQWQYRDGDQIPATGVTIEKWSDIVKDLFRVVMTSDNCPQLTLGRVDDSDDIPTASEGYAPTAFTMKYSNVYSAIKTLSTIMGNWQWGVDGQRQLYCYPREKTVAHNLQVGKEITEFKPILDASKIINRILLRGGTAKETTTNREYRFFREGRDEDSIEQYGIHFAIRNEPSIRDIAAAELYMNAVFEEFAEPQDRVDLEVVPNVGLFEPQSGMVHVFVPPDAHQYYQITKTRYRITDNGLIVQPKLGYRPPDIIAEMVSMKETMRQLLTEGATEEFFYTFPLVCELEPNLSCVLNIPLE